MFDYNTQREFVILKEYGRNVQKLVKYIKTIEDKEKRNQSARALVELMKQINPSIKESGEDSQKLWDDLYIMSDFSIDIEGPFPEPKKEILYKKPDKLRYKEKDIRYKHYGMNIQIMAEKAIQMENPEEKEAAIIYLGRLMKSFASIWSKDNLDDEVILDNIRQISKGLLDIDLQKVKENNLFDSLIKEKPRNYNHRDSHKDGNGGQGGRHKRVRRKRG